MLNDSLSVLWYPALLLISDETTKIVDNGILQLHNLPVNHLLSPFVFLDFVTTIFYFVLFSLNTAYFPFSDSSWIFMVVYRR